MKLTKERIEELISQNDLWATRYPVDTAAALRELLHLREQIEALWGQLAERDEVTKALREYVDFHTGRNKDGTWSEPT